MVDPCGSAGKESTCNSGDLGLIPGLERSPGDGKGYVFQCSCLENSMDCRVHGIAKSWTQLSDFHFHFLQHQGFPDDAVIKNPPANAGDTGDMGFIPGLGRSPGVGNGNPLQYSCLKNSMDRGAWWATAYGVSKSRTRLSDEHTSTQFSVKGQSGFFRNQITTKEVFLNSRIFKRRLSLTRDFS